MWRAVYGRFVVAMLVVGLAGISLSSCGASAATAPHDATSTASVTPLASPSSGAGAVVAGGLPPSQLDAVVSVQAGYQKPLTIPGVYLAVTFTSHGQPAMMDHSETLTCQGELVPAHANGFANELQSVPKVITGPLTLICIYSGGGQSASFAVSVPARPTVTSPAPGATLSASAPITITYKTDPGFTTVQGFGVSDSDTTWNHMRSGPVSAPTGSYTLPATVKLPAGFGQLLLKATLAPKASQFSPFASMTVQATAQTFFGVTWR